MKPILGSPLPYLAALALLVVTPAFAHDAAPGAAPTSTVALDPRLGYLHHPVSTRDRQAQAYFDHSGPQGDEPPPLGTRTNLDADGDGVACESLP